MNVLVDTPVWSLILRREKPTPNYQSILLELVQSNRAALIGPIKQELLSGLRHKEQFEKIRVALNDLPCLTPEDEDYEFAASFYNLCIAKGIQGSPTDFLLCAVAVRRDMEILTTDKDFDLYQKHLPIRLLKI